jgi:hypothetical protein
VTEGQSRAITVTRLLESAPLDEYLTSGETDRRLDSAIERAMYVEAPSRQARQRVADLEFRQGEPREFPAVADVEEIVDESPGAIDANLGWQGAALLDDVPADDTDVRAASEAFDLLQQVAIADPYNPVLTFFRGRLLGRFSRDRAPAIARSFIRWTKQAGEVVSLERVYQPVPVVAGAIPARQDASGELTAAFERSKSGGIEVSLKAAGGSFSVKYLVSDSRSVVLQESTTGGLVVGVGSLLIPLDRQVILVPMTRGGEPFPVVRYLPVRGAGDLLGWDARAGDAVEVSKLALGTSVPLTGTLPQDGSREKSVEMDATVSLGWANKAETASAKASLGVSAKFALGMSWSLPAGSFQLRWADSRVVGAVIR